MRILPVYKLQQLQQHVEDLNIYSIYHLKNILAYKQMLTSLWTTTFRGSKTKKNIIKINYDFQFKNWNKFNKFHSYFQDPSFTRFSNKQI